MREILRYADKYELTTADSVWILSQDILYESELAWERNG